MLLVITTIIILVFTMSRYTSTVATRDVTRVATMADNVNFSITDTVSGYPGCPDFVYPIEITNAVEDKVCEVSQKFNLKIKGLEEANIPLQIGLYSDSNTTTLIPGNEGVYESNDFSFSPGVKETKKFYLKISWPSDKNSDYYSREIDYLKIDVVLTQIN